MVLIYKVYIIIFELFIEIMKTLINKEDKIFIAGATGMVGKSIKNSLTQKKYLNLLTPNRNQLDLLDSESVKEWFKNNKPSVVIIAAAKVGGIMANSKYPVEFLLENIKIQNNIIENSEINGVKRLLFLGSSCIYPKNAPQPIKEEYLLDGLLEKTNESYALAKITGLKLCESLRLQKGFDSISVMPTNLYGPGDNYHPEYSHVMASLIKKFCEAKKYSKPNVTCWGTGNPLREFLHVRDLSDACLFLLERWNPTLSNAPKDSNNNKLYHLNIGTGKEISIKELALKISNLVKYKGKIIWDETKPDGTLRKRLDVKNITSMGWSPKIDLDNGLEQTIIEFNKKYF